MKIQTELSNQIAAITFNKGVDAALMRQFSSNGTSLAAEAIDALADDLLPSAYPNFDTLKASAAEPFEKCVVAAVAELFGFYGRHVPAAFYNVLLTAAFESQGNLMYRMFEKTSNISRDRLFDAVLHATLLVTPIGMHVQSVLSGYGLELLHVMNCGCKIRAAMHSPFVYSITADTLHALTDNLKAATLEQYGVNARTSGDARGF